MFSKRFERCDAEKRIKLSEAVNFCADYPAVEKVRSAVKHFKKRKSVTTRASVETARTFHEPVKDILVTHSKKKNRVIGKYEY